MVKIRLARIGYKKKPIYRVVAADSRMPRDGRFLEILGSYNPHSDPAEINLKADRILTWIRQGAQPTPTVESLLKKQGISKKLKETQAA
jgi:small subunit ribosomal protein S16